jgi:predicted ATPase/class 3 adenylate cyclase
MSGDRPSGTVTFLFTDIEGSTRLWDEHGSEMKDALAIHDEILRSAIESELGYIFSTQGDAFAAAFHSAGAAARCAIAIQSALDANEWPADTPINVRIGLHVGEAQERDGDYFGPAVNRTARIMSAGHGGQILTSDVVPSLIPQLDVVDLGRHRLKDLVAPEHIWQVGVPGMRSGFPALRSVDATINNLPVQRTELLGRVEETATVVDLLADHRLVTLTGFGGTGKTRLAVAVAAEVGHRYPRGVFFVDLAPLTDGGRVGVAAAEAAGMSAESLSGDGTIHERAARAMAGQNLLLVLDNCEHLIDDVVEYLDHLLDLAGTPTVLATSREALEIDGEYQFRVRPFAVDDLDTSSVAVELFTQRAAAVGRDVEPSDPAVQSICRQLDGLPLAIELAAARTAMLSPDELAVRLTGQLEVLSSRRRQRGRHRSLEAVLDWSWNLLDAGARELLVQLGSFTGGWTLAAAEAVCDDPTTVAERLQTLVSCSLVEPAEGSTGTQFRMLEPVRQLSLTHLSRGSDADRLEARHLGWLLESASTRTYGEQCTSSEWAATVNADLDNWLAAVDFAMSVSKPSVAGDLFGAVAAACFDGLRAGEVDLVLNSLLASAERPAARLLITGAFNDISTGNHVRLVERAQAALRIAIEDGDRPCEALARIYVAYSTATIDPVAARHDSELAVTSAEQTGDDDLLALALAWAGAVSFIADDIETALDQLHRAIELTAGRSSLAAMHAHLGLYFVGLESDEQDPTSHLTAVINQTDAPGHAQSANIFLAFVHARGGDLDALERVLVDALQLSRDYGNANFVADASLAAAESLHRDGDADGASRVVAALHRQTFTVPFVYRRYRKLRYLVPEHDRPPHRLDPEQVYDIARQGLESFRG